MKPDGIRMSEEVINMQEYELRQIDAWNYGDEESWVWNDSWVISRFQADPENIEATAIAEMERLGISFTVPVEVVEYGICSIEFRNAITEEPLIAAQEC